jgi:response regulator NasT
VVAKVLIVEDDALQADDLEDVIAAQGHEVCAKVRSSTAALYVVRTQSPDVVLMDVAIAGSQDGIDTAAVIQAISPCGVVFVTAHGDSETSARMRRLGPAAILLKPASSAAVIAAVQSAAQRSPPR